MKGWGLQRRVQHRAAVRTEVRRGAGEVHEGLGPTKAGPAQNQASKQAGKQASRQAGKQASKQASRQETTHQPTNQSKAGPAQNSREAKRCEARSRAWRNNASTPHLLPTCRPSVSRPPPPSLYIPLTQARTHTSRPHGKPCTGAAASDPLTFCLCAPHTRPSTWPTQYQPTNQICKSINQIHQPTSQSTNQSITQSANQSISQSTNQQIS